MPIGTVSLILNGQLFHDLMSIEDVGLETMETLMKITLKMNTEMKISEKIVGKLMMVEMW